MGHCAALHLITDALETIRLSLSVQVLHHEIVNLVEQLLLLLIHSNAHASTFETC